MTPVIKRDDTFGPLAGNPMLLSLDGQVRAPLATILSASWSAQDRAAFGVYLVERFQAPDGKKATGAVRYELAGGVVREAYDVVDAETPQPGRYELLEARVAALEAKLK